MTTSFESSCSAYHIGHQEKSLGDRWHQCSIEAAAEEAELNEGCIQEIAKDHDVTVAEIEEYLNKQR